MRAIIALSIFHIVASDSSSSSSTTTSSSNLTCLVNTVGAVDQATDAATYIWAAYTRCGGVHQGTGSNGDVSAIKCVVDVASAIQSADAMVIIILKALDTCGQLAGGAVKNCGLAAGVLAKNMAGLVAASASTLQLCPLLAGSTSWESTYLDILKNNTNPLSLFGGLSHDGIQCIIDSKDAARSVITVVKQFMDMGTHCMNMSGQSDARPCAQDVLRLIGGLASIGNYVAGALGTCSIYHQPDTQSIAKYKTGSLCAQSALQLLDHTAKVAGAATDMSMACNFSSSSANNSSTSNTTQLFDQGMSKLTLLRLPDLSSGAPVCSEENTLGTFLPVTAIVGLVTAAYFVGFSVGRLYNKADSQFVHNDDAWRMGPLE
jgi:hypothetical protein